jgi:hypothetical protein
MDISKIDKNFASNEITTMDGKTYYKIPHHSFDLYGVWFDEKNSRFVRMDQECASAVSQGVQYCSKNTTGGRLRFSTNATVIGVRVAYDEFCRMSHMAISGSSGFALLEELDDECRLTKAFRPNFTDEKGFSGEVYLEEAKLRDFILHFPLYNNITSLEIVLNEGAIVKNGRPYREIKPILYYGSSITQGGCASRADNSYQSYIAKWNNIDFINLGFSGNAKAELAMADYLANIDCSIFVCDYDYNAETAQELEAAHYLFYKRYRQTQKETPILFISKPDFEYDASSARREAIIRETYERAKSEGDNNVYFLVGRTFYGEHDRENCSVDGCHPNDLGFYYMAKKIYAKLQEINEIFK